MQPWSRDRLLGLLVGAAVVLVVLVIGLVVAVYVTIRSARGAEATPGAGARVARGVDPGHHGTAQGQARRDAIAAAPMYAANAQDMKPSTPATTPATSLVVPIAERVGPARVPTGFPHTPAGAVGQLGEIDTTVLESMSVQIARAVYRAWALPGGPGGSGWVMTRNVTSFLGATEQSATKDPATTVSTEPVGAMVKGTDGADWTLACVQLRVTATVSTRAQIGYGHCSRMQWNQGRWMIAPGTQPAVAPSTWPGTQASRRAGWLTWAVS